MPLLTWPGFRFHQHRNLNQESLVEHNALHFRAQFCFKGSNLEEENVRKGVVKNRTRAWELPLITSNIQSLEAFTDTRKIKWESWNYKLWRQIRTMKFLCMTHRDGTSEFYIKILMPTSDKAQQQGWWR